MFCVGAGSQKHHKVTPQFQGEFYMNLYSNITLFTQLFISSYMSYMFDLFQCVITHGPVFLTHELIRIGDI